jgi:CBS domain-containing protein
MRRSRRPEVKVRDVMVSPVFEVSPTDSCQRAAELMRDFNTGALAITTEQHVLEGFITDRDLTVRCTALGCDPSVEQVGDFCDLNPVSITPDVELETATEVMQTAGVRRLPVVEASNRVIGIISLDDVALHLRRYFDAFLDVVAQYRRT